MIWPLMIKGILFTTAILLGAYLGTAFNINKKIAQWRFYLTGALFIFAIFLAFFTPVSITTRTFDKIANNPSLKSIHLKIDEDFNKNLTKISDNIYISKDSNKIDFLTSCYEMIFGIPEGFDYVEYSPNDKCIVAYKV